MQANIDLSFSKSPLKPKLLLKFLKRHGIYDQFLELKTDFKPFVKSDFLIAHTNHYVDAVFEGNPPCESNSLPWSEQLVTSVCWTNASLFHAMDHSVHNPDEITFSVTSGFHHASPDSGFGFCTFSGQVIAAVKLYRKNGIKCCFLDLDGHFGNSIEDTREFVSDLNLAVPLGFNINPSGKHKDYIESLIKHLEFLEIAILNNEIDSVVWCHGADSHSSDDLGGQCTTEEWLKCSEIFYSWVRQINVKRGKPLPVTLSLFGGYRVDDYDSVLSLHTADLVECIKTLCNGTVEYTPIIKENPSRDAF